MASIFLDKLERSFRDGARALAGVSLEIADGELVVVVGPSGSGKTTLLRAIAGLEPLDGGSVRFGERVVDGLAPRERGVAMVFQGGALYPHLDVRRNLEFPLRVAGVVAAERSRRVDGTAELLGIAELLDRKPASLSGGEQQRVALGRAIVREPEVFLLDEPFSQLDTDLGRRLQNELRRLQRRLGTKMVVVTHDQEEAIELGDRIAVLVDGSVAQLGTPEDILDRPADRFVATFFGWPGMNVIDGRVAMKDGRVAIVTDGERLVELEGSLAALAKQQASDVALGFRPGDASIRSSHSDGDLAIEGTIERIETRTDARLIHVALSSTITIVVKTSREETSTQGETVRVSIDADRAFLFGSGPLGSNLRQTAL